VRSRAKSLYIMEFAAGESSVFPVNGTRSPDNASCCFTHRIIRNWAATISINCIYRAFHYVLRDYKNLLQETRRTRIYETCTDRRNNSKMFSPVSCFSSQFTFLPLGDASVCSEKMAAAGKKSFCVLEYHTSKSAVTVQRAFRAKYSSHHCHVTALT